MPNFVIPTPSLTRSVIAIAASFAIVLTMAVTPASAHPEEVQVQLTSPRSVTDYDPEIDNAFLDVLQSVKPGQRTTYSIDGVDLDISNVAGQLHIDELGADQKAVCAVAVASGLVLLGAAALATLAFATAGAGGAIIAGHLFLTNQIWAAAGLLGAWGALLTWVEKHIC